MDLQLVQDHGKLLIVFPHAGEVPRGGAVAKLRQLRVLPQSADAGQILARRPAPMIADAIEAHEVVERSDQLAGATLDMLTQIAGKGAVFVRNPKGQYARAIPRLPPEQAAGKVAFMRVGPHEDICVHSTLAENLRQGS